MTSTCIQRARATPVIVPARPDSLNSPDVVEDSSFAAKYRTGGKWDEFPNQIKWIVELETKDGCCGIGETYRSVERSEMEKALSPLLGLDVLRMNWSRMPVENIRIYDGIESAVMDIAGKKLGVPVYQLLGGAYRDRVECSGWTGRRTPEDAARKANEAMQCGHKVFKFKCSDDDAVREWIDQIKQLCGNGIRILLDPNQRWNDVETTMRLLEGIDLSIFYGLEDPVDRSNYKAFRELKQRLKGVPLFMHIALPYLHQGQKAEDILTALKEECVDGFNFNGSMFGFIRLARIAEVAGLPCWHGSEVDLGILEVSALHACAAVSNCTIPSDLLGELVRQDDLIEPGILFDQGFALVPQGPGLGVKLDQSALKRFEAGKPIEVHRRANALKSLSFSNFLHVQGSLNA